MPYSYFTTTVKGKKKWCTKNLETGQVVHYDSPEKRKHGVMMRHAVDKGFKPDGSEGTGKIKKS